MRNNGGSQSNPLTGCIRLVVFPVLLSLILPGLQSHAVATYPYPHQEYKSSPALTQRLKDQLHWYTMCPTRWCIWLISHFTFFIQLYSQWHAKMCWWTAHPSTSEWKCSSQRRHTTCMAFTNTTIKDNGQQAKADHVLTWWPGIDQSGNSCGFEVSMRGCWHSPWGSPSVSD